MNVVFTDGSCSGNPGPGGWAFVSEDGNLKAGGYELRTTNNRMELTAVWKALAASEGDIEIRSDSKYVTDCINKNWYVGWIKNDWKRGRKREPVCNQDLWKPFLQLLECRRNAGATVVMTWVRGHDGTLGNELANTAATEQTKIAQKMLSISTKSPKSLLGTQTRIGSD